MFNWLKGGKKDMARNLVKEQEEKKEEENIKAEVVGDSSNKQEVKVITIEALILNRLEVIEGLVRELAKQVGANLN